MFYKSKVKLITGSALAASAVFLTGCSTAANTSNAISSIQVESSATIIDVRTPTEFSSGFVKGAINYDIQSPSFMTDITSLPLDGSYVVYCRSGNRSAVAANMMRDAGFTSVIDAGSVAEASEFLNLDIIT